MRYSIRLTVLALAGLAALAFAGSALASYTPVFFVNQSTYQPSSASLVQFVAQVPRTDEATAKVTIVSPPNAYQANLTQAAGTTLGTAVATVKANDLAGAPLTGKGTVVVGSLTDPTPLSPSNAPAAAAAVACTGTAAHTALWIIDLTVQGQRIQIPLFIDFTTFFRLQTCFQSPYAAAGAQKAPFGIQLVLANFIVRGVFTNPAAGLYGWGGVFTPWVNQTATADSANTVEARGIVPFPYKITLKRQKSKASSVKLGGSVNSPALPLTGNPLDLYVGPKTSTLKFTGHTTKVSSKNQYSVTRKSSKKTTYFQTGFGPANVLAAGGCQGTSLAPKGCVSATLSPTYSNIVKVNPPPKPKPKKKRRR